MQQERKKAAYKAVEGGIQYTKLAFNIGVLIFCTFSTLILKRPE
jgi:hypothetical protein